MAIDLTQSAAQVLIALINQANPTLKNGPLDATRITLGVPQTLTNDVNNKNTKLTITGVLGHGYKNQATVRYSRIDIHQLFLAKGVNDLSFVNQGYTTSSDLLAYLNATYALNLTTNDITVEALPADDDITGKISYTLTIAAGSLLFTGALPLTITPQSINLNRAFKGNVLNGFVPPDTTRVNLATALTGTLLDLYTVAQLQQPAA